MSGLTVLESSKVTRGERVSGLERAGCEGQGLLAGRSEVDAGE